VTRFSNYHEIAAKFALILEPIESMKELPFLTIKMSADDLREAFDLSKGTTTGFYPLPC
jgi:hypothetical protein